MKKILLIVSCLFAFSVISKAHAAFIITPGFVIYPETWKNLKASQFVMLSTKDLRKINGRKFSLKERVALSMTKIKMKQALKRNQNLTVGEYLDSPKKLSGGWIILIVLAGLFLAVYILFLIAGPPVIF